MKLFKFMTAAVFFMFVFAQGSLADTITKQESKFSNDTQIRFDVTTMDDSQFTENDDRLLKEFISTTNLAVIKCNAKNCEMVKARLTKLEPTINFELRYYGENNPRILNKRASEKLAKLVKGDISRGAITVITIENSPGDIRAVVIKDNKNYAASVSGTEEKNDHVGNENDVFCNIAIREISEEIGIGGIEVKDLEKIGHIEFLNNSPVLDLKWINNTSLFTYHVDTNKTRQWLASKEIPIKDDNIISQKVGDNSEIEWIFVIKPEALKSGSDLMLPLDGDKTVRLSTHHAELISVVFKGKFNKDALVGRTVDYLNGKVLYNGIETVFVKANK